MNRKIVLTTLFTLLIVITIQGRNAGTGNDPVGKWKFNCPGAPYGYNIGTIDISKDGDLFVGTMKFQDFDYLFPCDGLVANEDKISFSLWVEDSDVYIVMRFSEDDQDTLNGTVDAPDGELSISAKRIKE